MAKLTSLHSFFNSFFSPTLKNIFKKFRYENLSKNVIENITRTGTFCRTLLPLFIPLSIYQYIRQTDKDRYAEELFLQYVKGEEMKKKDSSFLIENDDTNWRIKYDLYLIDKAVNS
ncbi:conserved Plasmodium protein, unknown function [Plasmodium sp. gorilla clade G2]|uniref:conserved Plasmodium protein, unknown function n=1 Tax=Plasmodium sp. gorilla clade G2 TaxID=880535 RepID=UPI000D20241E|nr:conserved Plasmodium protein, unknown function [Plasmodium sp. gorilla clade G2]SOV17726.1 conserved Plasmodium protein, unknown function [Plasmodium sp. gorilla clade G2]